MNLMRRFSIGKLMAVVCLIACDFGIMRFLFTTTPLFHALVLLPMLNVMLLSIPGLRKPQPKRRFWITFEVVGLTFQLLITFLLWYDFESCVRPLNAFEYSLPKMDEPTKILLEILVIVITTWTPQLLLAWIVAELVSRYRIVRRQATSEDESNLRGPSASRPTDFLTETIDNESELD